MTSSIETFESGWGHVRGLTFDFIAGVPADQWEFSPHPRFARFNKQVRHMVCVQGVYIDGIRNRVTDFGKKHSHYGGPLDRDSLVAALQQKDAELHQVLDEIGPGGEAEHTIEFYGKQPLAQFLSTILHHEAIHHGQWSLYAALAGFETPQSWKLNWGL
jgi:uncharacterized damage-inducible protein DinB